MTDIPSALKKIQQEEVKYGQAVSEATQTKIGGTANYLIDNAIDPIGTIIQSILTETQFQAIKGNKWVRMSGQSISGSDLSTLTGITTLPNMIGNSAFLRQASAEGNIGVYQSNQNLAHTHFIANGDTVEGDSVLNDLSPTNRLAYRRTGGDLYRLQGTATLPDRGISSTSGGTESRPNNYQVNYFIKINNNNT